MYDHIPELTKMDIFIFRKLNLQQASGQAFKYAIFAFLKRPVHSPLRRLHMQENGPACEQLF